MKTTKLLVITTAVIIFAACHAAKKSTASTVASSVPVANEPIPSFPAPKDANGIYPPGKPELTAMQVTYKEVTLNTLMEGYSIYTEGACINCHGDKSIYPYSEVQWKDIVDDMAVKAGISDAQKNAVYKYVLAIKATQPK